ncbi:MAG: hypothetical protein MUO52_07280 [Desulfobacterales bacterium]|nr:hypothetical protein [Desulfobacterales bacterium]
MTNPIIAPFQRAKMLPPVEEQRKIERFRLTATPENASIFLKTAPLKSTEIIGV